MKHGPDPHHATLPLWPNVVLPDNEADGLLPSCRVRNWNGFFEVMRSRQLNLAGEDWVYRGQRRHDWQLSSTLGRRFGDGPIEKDYHDKVLQHFKLSMRGRGIDLSQVEDNEVWAFGQHHGLATPLLDWSLSPFVALFFAFDEPDVAGEPLNGSRAVVLLNKSRLAPLDEELFLEPSLNENARLVSQAGLFTVTPAGDDNLVSRIIQLLDKEDLIGGEAVSGIEDGDAEDDDGIDDTKRAEALSKFMLKIHVPNTGRAACLDMLRQSNIHPVTLFPDAQGASRGANDWLDRMIAEDRAARVEAVKRSALTPSASSPEPTATAPPADLQELVADLPDFETWTVDREQFARAISSAYERNKAVDWTQHQNRQAKLRVALRRAVRASGVPRASTETLVDVLFDFFFERAVPSPKPKSAGFDFFAGIRDK